MNDHFFIAYALLFAGLMVWACVAEYVEGWCVRFIMRSLCFFARKLSFRRVHTKKGGLCR